METLIGIIDTNNEHTRLMGFVNPVWTCFLEGNEIVIVSSTTRETIRYDKGDIYKLTNWIRAHDQYVEGVVNPWS